MPSNYGLSILQQGAEAIAQAQAEKEKAEAQVIGNRGLYEKAVKAGLIPLERQTEYLRGNAKTRDSILAGAMREHEFKRQEEADKMRQQAFALDQNRYGLEKNRFDTENARYAAAEKAAQEKAAAQQAHIKAGPQITWSQGMPFELTATGDYRPITMPPTSAPRTPTVKVQGMDVPITTEAGQAQLKAMNPAGEAHDKFGANPTDFLPENVERGSVPLNDIKKYGFQPWSKDFPTPTHVKLKKLGKVMEEGEYTGWLRKFADAGQLDGPVWNPVTDEMIEPNRQLTANRSANPRKLDPSNAASIEIMQGFIKQARAIPDSPVDPLTLARQLAHEQGYIW